MSKSTGNPIYRTLIKMPPHQKLQVACLPVRRFQMEGGRLLRGKPAEQFKTKAEKFDTVLLDRRLVSPGVFKPTYEEHAFGNYIHGGGKINLQFLPSHADQAEFFMKLGFSPDQFALLTLIRNLHHLYLPGEAHRLASGVAANQIRAVLDDLLTDNPSLGKLAGDEELKGRIMTRAAASFTTNNASLGTIARVFDDFANPALSAGFYPGLLGKLNNLFSGSKLFVFSVISFEEKGAQFLDNLETAFKIVEMDGSKAELLTWPNYLTALGIEEKRAIEFLKLE